MEESKDFARDLGRYLTWLLRSRKRFMGEHLREHGLSGAMYMILLHIDRRPGCTQDDLANHMYLDKSNVARRVKQLEELSCVCRETDPADRRENHLYLTPQGKELVPVIREYLSQWGESVTADLSEEERDTLLELLRKMAK